MDNKTKQEIMKVTWKTLRDAGLTEPPVSINNLLGHLELHREFYNLQNPRFLDRAKHRLQINGQKIIRILHKIKLDAVLLFDENRIVVDCEIPEIRRDWPTFHEATHRVLPWHKPYFYCDTAQTLNPDWQQILEAEANYGASEMMFCGPVFTREALDTLPKWESIKILKKRYGKSYHMTLRRYIEHSHDNPMAMVVSTPLWMDKPDDQKERWRHFIGSKRFKAEFSNVTPGNIISFIDTNTNGNRGGPSGQYLICLEDANGEQHEFCTESFFNQYYLLTLLVHKKKMTTRRIVIPGTVSE